MLTDTAVVGRLGTVPLGGLALASTVLNTLVWVFNFLSYGTTVRVAVRRGRGDRAGAATDALQALWLALGIGLAVALAIGLAARWLVALIGDDPAVIDQGVTYLRVSVVGVPFQFVTIACIGYLYGLPDTKRPVPRPRLSPPRPTSCWSWCSCSASTGGSPAARGAR